MKTPNVVGAAEAAEILGVEVQRISRLRDKLPPLAADLRATPVWHTIDIERHRDGKPPVNRKAQKLDLLGTSEAAHLLMVDKSQIGRWRRNGKFPKPCKELKAGPLWWFADISAFHGARSIA